MDELTKQIQQLQNQIDRLIKVQPLINGYYKRDSDSDYSFYDVASDGRLYVHKLQGMNSSVELMTIEQFNSLQEGSKEDYDAAQEQYRLYRIAQEWL